MDFSKILKYAYVFHTLASKKSSSNKDRVVIWLQKANALGFKAMEEVRDTGKPGKAFTKYAEHIKLQQRKG